MPAPEWLNDFTEISVGDEDRDSALPEMSLTAYGVVFAQTVSVENVLDYAYPPLFSVAGHASPDHKARYLIAASIRENPDRLRLELHHFDTRSETVGCTEASCGVVEAAVDTSGYDLLFGGIKGSGRFAQAGKLLSGLALGVAFLQGFKGGSDLGAGRLQVVAAKVMTEERGHTLSDESTAAAFEESLAVASRHWL